MKNTGTRSLKTLRSGSGPPYCGGTSYMFYQAFGYGITGNVEDTYGSFEYTNNSQVEMKNWNISSANGEGYVLTDNMFYDCKRFNPDVSGWTIENVYSLSHCFYNNSHFKGKGLSSWTVKDGYSSRTQWPPIIPTSSYKYFYKFDFSGLTFDGSSSYDITDSNYGSFDINNTLFFGSTPRSVYI